MDTETSVSLAPRPSTDTTVTRYLEAQRLYLQAIARRLCRVPGPGNDGASDLVQRTLMVAIQGDAIRKVDPSKWRAWLRGTLLNINRERFRRRQPNALPEPSVVVDESSSPGSKVARIEERDLLKHALRRLSDRDRQVLTWYHDEEITFREIGERMGFSAVAAHKAYHKALGRLRAEYERVLVRAIRP